ncbi:MAG: hypothetical protein AMXMBFR59_38620 [Rhodanobacteraceae bacterium]
MPARQAFEIIVYVLRTGIPWKALPKERFGSASAVHKRFLEWEAVGFFETLWKAGLAEYAQMASIAWRWRSVDGAMMKAHLAQGSVGPNSTHRGNIGNCWLGISNSQLCGFDARSQSATVSGYAYIS